MTTLYEMLGVPPDATADEIGKSYQAKAKRCHPDLNGGDSIDEFKRIAHAYEVLGDENKRRRYDETGETEPQKNTALSTVILCVHEALLETVKSGRDPEKVDLLRIAKGKLQKIRDGLIETIEAARKQSAMIRKVADRLECDETDSNESPLKASVLQPALKMESEAREAERKLSEIDECDEIMEHYRYRYDKPSEPTWPPKYGENGFNILFRMASP